MDIVQKGSKGYQKLTIHTVCGETNLDPSLKMFETAGGNLDLHHVPSDLLTLNIQPVPLLMVTGKSSVYF
mgnify:CR=1 FL=1